MKKRFVLIIALFMLAVCSPSYALQNWGDNDLWKQLKQVFNTNTTTATDSGSQIAGINATGDVTFQQNLIANGRRAASTQLSSSSTQLSPANLPYCIILKNIGSGFGLDVTPGTTLQNGTNGQVLTFLITGVMNGGTWVVTPTTATGWRTLTFSHIGDNATLLYVNSTIGWIIVSTGGTANTTPAISTVAFI